MLDRFRLHILLQGLTLLMLGPACEASSLGLTVHVVPLNSNGGKTVRAYFSVIAPSPCPSLSGLCAAGEDCLVYTTPLPFTGTKPSDWCVRQWQKTVPSIYNATINLGSKTKFYVSMNAGPKIRANNGRLNHPAFVALPPPLRARVNCPQPFHLSVKDLDGDKVRCRFASSDKGECVSCTQHSFIELNEEKCILSFTGKAPTGQYFIYLMVEDQIPLPRINQVTDSPLSSVPVHLSLTVEESSFTCSDVPVAIDRTPKQDSVLFVLPYQEEKINIDYRSEQESVLELAVVGPPDLYRTGFASVGPLATLAMGWIRSENNLTHLLPICFTANTKSLQSEPRCVWLYQRETRALPAGTELKCGKTEMTLVLPITSLTNINLAELQLNSPTCSVTYNNTHLTANISLNGCGTKTVHSGSELVYTNTLKSVRPYTVISRQPSLILPLACRIPRAQVKGPNFSIGMPTERETFGEFRIWIEVYLPGQGPLADFTKNPKFRTNFRVRREADSGTGSNSTNSISTSEQIGTRLSQLDLYVRSNTTVARADMIVNSCIESETEDFAESRPIVNQGCITSSNNFEIITGQNNTRVYRLNLNTIQTNKTTFYVQCTVNLCISTTPSQSCPDLCTRSGNQSILIGSVFSRTYTVTSGPISLVLTTPAPTMPTTVTTDKTATMITTVTTNATSTPTTVTVTVTATTVNTAGQNTTSNAPEQASSLAAGMILTTFSIFLQKLVFY
ncbi:mucin-5AC-like [Archocentrus centrarchus]|uniref:mucin-5AC-like n=1 Tax=Archocentrus centrarchus TaxID=63155 RepID=UPI0011EA3D39|nr:mucin-5AC-like [Archocentrus centrarchus]XP_030614661.1 mucin-5AC-like [Archocentrus centrarchus]XP_030614667.1 mucin-5AC-like [Archocentrus centrarchus]